MKSTDIPQNHGNGTTILNFKGLNTLLLTIFYIPDTQGSTLHPKPALDKRRLTIRERLHISETMCETDANRNVAFKSLIPSVRTWMDIEEMVGDALFYQYMFDKRTSPWEMAEWPDGQLEKFKVESEAVERLYYIYSYDDGVSGQEYSLVVRVIYRDKPVYAYLSASCDFTGFECEGGGEIYISLDAQIFLKSIINSDFNPHDIWASMVEDGLKVEEPSDFDLLPTRLLLHGVPKLMFLCHMKIYKDEKERLREAAARYLPKILADSVEDFIKERRVRDYYDSLD
nr:MAG: hypothetical protein [Metapenaeus ensis nimavirus]